jgi:hypothetical protein
MLPVKSILKEYLADDGEDDTVIEHATPAVEPVVPESFVQDISGAGIPEAIPEAMPEMVPAVEVTKQEEPKPVVEVTKQEESKPVETPTIIVDTEPAKVGFTSMDTFFDSHNPSQNSIHQPVVEDEDDETGVTSLEISNDPPEPMNEYEDLEEVDALPIDEFETL